MTAVRGNILSFSSVMMFCRVSVWGLQVAQISVKVWVLLSVIALTPAKVHVYQLGNPRSTSLSPAKIFNDELKPALESRHQDEFGLEGR
jgi:hypothetical protein